MLVRLFTYFFSPFGCVGAFSLEFLGKTGSITLFFLKALRCLMSPPWYGREIFRQILEIGFFSLPVVALTAIFSGMVLALQSYTGFSRFSAQNAIATVVVLSIVRELGPVLAGLMVAGRVGASIAAEVGTMRVTDQIDALQVLSISPYRYVVVPRVLAGMLVLPMLVFVADVIGILGGYLICVYKLDFNEGSYMDQTLKALQWNDIKMGLLKAFCFGLLLTLMGTYHGYYSKGGAQGVGQATTRAVVYASIFILFSNYLLTALLFSKG